MYQKYNIVCDKCGCERTKNTPLSEIVTGVAKVFCADCDTYICSMKISEPPTQEKIERMMCDGSYKN